MGWQSEDDGDWIYTETWIDNAAQETISHTNDPGRA